MSEYFPEPKSSGGRVKVELDFSNYATKSDFKNATDVDTSKFPKKVDLAGLKSNVDELDIDKLKNIPGGLRILKRKIDKLDNGKLETTPFDLSKLSDVVKNYHVKKDVYNAMIKNIEEKILDTINLATNTTLNGKINKVNRNLGRL